MAFRSEDAGGSIKGWEWAIGFVDVAFRLVWSVFQTHCIATSFFLAIGVVVVVVVLLKFRSHCIFHIPLSFFLFLFTSRKSMHRCTSSTYPYDHDRYQPPLPVLVLVLVLVLVPLYSKFTF